MMADNHSYQDIYETCKKHMHSYVLVETTDGLKTDGIITGLDEENLYMAVPIESSQGQIGNNPNQYGRNPYPGYRPGYGYPRRRFRRLIIPLAFLATLSLLPWY